MRLQEDWKKKNLIIIKISAAEKSLFIKKYFIILIFLGTNIDFEL
jgi:hypothetical protein